MIGRRWGVAGDSIAALAVMDNADAKGWTSASFVSWFRRYLQDAIDLPQSRVWAKASALIGPTYSGPPERNNLIEDQLSQALRAQLDGILLTIGTNSIGPGWPTSFLIAQYRRVLDALIGNGTFVLAVGVRARSGGAVYNSLQAKQQVAALNRWLLDYAMDAGSGRMLFVDPNPLLVDFSTGNAKAGLYTDGLHDNNTSAQLQGKFLADKIRPLLPSMDAQSVFVSDTFDAASNPGGNLLANPFFSGTGGALISGATGVFADSWDMLRFGSMTVVGSKVASPIYTGMSDQVLTFGGTLAGRESTLQAYYNSFDGKIVPGDVVQFGVEIDYAATGLAGVSIDFYAQDSANVSLITSRDGLAQAASGSIPATAGTFTMRTEPVTVPAGGVRGGCAIRFLESPSGTASGTATLRRASLRKVGRY